MKLSLTSIALLLGVSCMLATDSSSTPQQEFSPSAGVKFDGDRSFTFEEARSFREQFEPTFGSWTEGGDLSRYVYLNMSEFWPHIILGRLGDARELVTDHQGAVGAFAVDVAAGSTSVADYVSDSPTDGAIVVRDGRIVFEDGSSQGSVQLWPV